MASIIQSKNSGGRRAGIRAGEKIRGQDTTTPGQDPRAIVWVKCNKNIDNPSTNIVWGRVNK